MKNATSLLHRCAFPLSIAAALAGGLAGCEGAPDDGEPGVAVLSLVQAPAEVRCVRVIAAGSRTVVRLFETMAGQSTQFELRALPLGVVVFTGEAFALPCSMVNNMSVPDWLSDPTPVTILAGTPAPVSLTMRRNGRASVTVDFADETNCAMPGHFCFTAALSGANENPPQMNPFMGGATLILDTTSGQAVVHLVHNVPDATAAHIHGPAMPGMNGPVVVGISPPGPDVTITATLPAVQVANLFSGLLYVNVHNPAAPGGAIRGQLLPGTP